MSIRETYQTRASTSRQEADQLQATIRYFPWLRAGFFIASILVMIRVWVGELSSLWGWVGLGLFIAFVVAAVRHQVLLRRRNDAELMHQVNTRALQRYDGNWQHFPMKGEGYGTPEHPYGHDLDLFGQGSLFQMLNVTTTWFGQQTFSQWLLQRATPEELKERQGLVADLKERLDLRQYIEREGLRIEADPREADPESFLAWVEAPNEILDKQWLWGLALIVPPWVVVSMSIWMWKVLPPWFAGIENPAKFAPYSAWWWLIPWFVVVGMFFLFTSVCQKNFSRVIFHERAFSLYRSLFEKIDLEEAKGQPFEAIQQSLRKQGWAPHEAMKRLQFLIDLAEVRQSPIVHLPFNLLVMWDIHCLFAMERWKKRVGPVVREWFKEVGRIEALSCLAGLAYDNPDYTFPAFADEGELIFEAKDLGHPLLPREGRVTNDFSLDADAPLALITGSNMSGKSTMLRAIGLNAVLAYTGSVVCAESLRLSMLQVGTSMRISDSLEQGVSYFMAELQRINRIVSLREGEVPLLYLLDEILHGTNTRERRIAAMGIIQLLQEAQSIGCVTTHDLELAEECKALGERVQFMYFTDLIEEQSMTFDYHLREGICPTTNALRLLQIVGIPLPQELLDANQT